MTTVKDSWKKVGEDISGIGNSIKSSELGKDMAQLGKDFGKSVVATVKHGIRAVSEWANTDEPEPSEPEKTAAEFVEEPAAPAEAAPETEEKTEPHDIIYD